MKHSKTSRTTFRTTFLKAYIIVMTVLCFALATSMIVLSYQRGNDGTCNAVAIIVLSINGIVFTAWPAKDKQISNTDISNAFRLQQRIALKKKLKALDVLN